MQLIQLFDCIHIIQWLMSGRAWHSIHYSFNNYRDVLLCKGGLYRGLDFTVIGAVDPPSL